MVEVLGRLGLGAAGILLTHHHADHIVGAGSVAGTFRCPVRGPPGTAIARSRTGWCDMKRFANNGRSGVPTCSSCRHFCDDPQRLEKMFAGILVLSSTYGSTRGRAGVCGIHQRFHDPEPACSDFVPRTGCFQEVAQDVTDQ